MPKLVWLFTIGVMTVGTHGAARACDAWYDTATGFAAIPCIGVLGETESYAVGLQSTGGTDFALRAVEKNVLANPAITALRIVTAPAPAALLYGFYPNGCWSAYRKPTVAREGNSVDIELKARVLTSSNVACIQVILPFVEAVPLFGIADPAALQYSVNGTPVTPIF